MKQIQLGDKVKDTITGFKGIVTARTEWINGCIRFNVQPQGLNKDNKLFEIETFDEQSLVIITPVKKSIKRNTGGPMKTLTFKP